MRGHSLGSSSMIGHGSAQHSMPGNDLIFPVNVSSATESDTFSDGSSIAEMSSSGSSSGHSDIYGESFSESTSRTIVPFYEYIREQELSSRQYYSIEEIKEKYIAWIMCQPQRHAQIKLKDDKAVPILIEYVEDIRARDKDKQRLVDSSNRKYALPAPMVDQLIEARRVNLLDKPKKKAAQIEDEIENERWQ